MSPCRALLSCERYHKEEIMGLKIYARILALVLLAMGAKAFAKDQPQVGYQQGTVIKVDRQEVFSPDTCCYDGTDRPLQFQYYAFNVTVKVGCTTYEGRYETPFDYFPSAISPGKSVQVRPAKHDLYFETPIWSDGKVPIVHRANDRTGPCGVNTASR